MATFQGAYCDGLHYIETTDTMNDLISNLDDLGCLSVYSSSDGTDTISELLSYSSSCSVMEYPMRCPDPHGSKKGRDVKLYRKSLWEQQQKTHLIMPILSSVFMVLSFFIFWRAAVVRKRIADPMDDARDARNLAPTRLEKLLNPLAVPCHDHGSGFIARKRVRCCVLNFVVVVVFSIWNAATDHLFPVSVRVDKTGCDPPPRVTKKQKRHRNKKAINSSYAR
jgi:hypothetical protein